MSNREAYITLCKEMDNVLIDSGIRAICIKCSTEGIEERKKLGITTLGCCTGCDYIGEEGCTSISLGCKVWFCGPMKIRFLDMLEEKGYLERFKEIKDKTYDFIPYSDNGCRVTVNEMFEGIS